MSEPKIYLDNAAATPIFPEAVKAMEPVLTDVFGNPSSAHSFGRDAANLIEQSKDSVAAFLNCQPTEVIFTSGGTESNNLAILGVAKAAKNRGNHIITTTIEHPSILNTCRALEKEGFEVTYLGVGTDGLVDLGKLDKTIKPETILVSIHLANSELGVIQPVEEISKITRNHNIYLHTDACQAAAYLDLSVDDLGVDLLTINGSKAYGPRGIGVLFVSDGVEIFPIIYGGGQQHGLRSGTENTAGIVGLATALDKISSKRDEAVKRIESLRDQLQEKLQNAGAKINVINTQRLPNHLSAVIPVSETDVVKYFDKKNIAVSSGSACSSRSLDDSHVLSAIGLSSNEINKTVRISLGYQTVKSDIEQFLEAI